MSPLYLLDGQSSAPRPSDLRRDAKAKLEPLMPTDFPLDDVLIALEEAYANILEHAFEGHQAGAIWIEVFWDVRGLNLVLTDRGKGGSKLHIVGEPRLSSQELLKRAAEKRGSLGLTLMLRVMDRVCYEVSTSGFNRLSMVKTFYRGATVGEELVIELTVESGIARVVLKGYVNMDTADYLSDRLNDFIMRENTTRFLIVANSLEYVSSAGVGVFIDLYDRFAKVRGKIGFLGLRPNVRRVFELVGFLAFFGDFLDEKEALSYLAEGTS